MGIQYTTPSPVNSYRPFTMFTTYRSIFACAIRLSPPPGLPTLLLTHVGIPPTHGWGAIKNPILLGCNTLFWPFLSITIGILLTLLGPMLLALHACPIHLSCRSLSAYSSSTAGEPVKNPFSVAY